LNAQISKSTNTIKKSDKSHKNFHFIIDLLVYIIFYFIVVINKTINMILSLSFIFNKNVFYEVQWQLFYKILLWNFFITFLCLHLYNLTFFLSFMRIYLKK